MADFAKSPLDREQLVLFPEKLDQIIPQEHAVRLVDEILGRVDWSRWEALYNLRRGQPPIHPCVVAAAVLYGLMKGIRSSRAIEEALDVRNDFRWLTGGQTIDHTTICKFRQKNAEALKNLFVQTGLIAQELGPLTLTTLGFDGTRMRADNRRTGTRTPEELRAAKAKLAADFAELEAKAAETDSADNDRLGASSGHRLSDELAENKRRQERVDRALVEIDRLEQADQKVPERIPITDPQSRVLPNKEGGYAPNYTPLITVDVPSGIVVGADVIANNDEDKSLIPAVLDVQKSFGLESIPREALADGLMPTGENLARCEELGIDLYSPIKMGEQTDNPAVREDPSRPVAPEDWERLPVTNDIQKDGSRKTQLHKEAFVYDQAKDCYWCPAGKSLPYVHQTSETKNGRTRVRQRYKAQPSDCAACPLAARCLSGRAKYRQIVHEQHERLRIAHAKKMATEAAREKYAQRRHSVERPFAVIKNQFGIRRFLVRGLKKVVNEWRWIAAAFNMTRLIAILARQGTGPPVPTPS